MESNMIPIYTSEQYSSFLVSVPLFKLYFRLARHYKTSKLSNNRNTICTTCFAFGLPIRKHNTREPPTPYKKREMKQVVCMKLNKCIKILIKGTMYFIYFFIGSRIRKWLSTRKSSSRQGISIWKRLILLSFFPDRRDSERSPLCPLPGLGGTLEPKEADDNISIATVWFVEKNKNQSFK